MKKTKQWFAVDTDGLKKLQEGKSKTFIIRELVQNVWDEQSSICKIEIAHKDNKITLVIEDDSPEGFRDITHAYTLFADTYKRRDATKRGRFNIGEKQVFSICDKIELTTTKGTLTFDENGRHESNNKRKAGTLITLVFPGTEAERNELAEYARYLLVPKNIRFTINGELIPSQSPVRKFEAGLHTELEVNGVFKRTYRQTTIEIYQPREKIYLYEMGIPVCEIDCQFSINVEQKIPLGIDRETVSQAYLRDLFAEVLNQTFDLVEAEHSSESWVREATRDERVSSEAVKDVLTKRFGEKFCAANPFDKQSIDEAISHGYNIVTGSELSKEEWAQIRRDALMPSSSELFSTSTVNAPTVEPNEKQKLVAKYAKKIAKELLGISINTRFVKHQQMVVAQFDRLTNTLTFNVAKLGNSFFEIPVSSQTTNLLLHEIGHHCGSHTESGYHECLTKMGADLTMLALLDPKFFEV